MEAWILILLSLITLAFSLKFFLFAAKSNKPTLPPGPSAIVFFAKNILFQKKSVLQLEQIINELHKIYGPIVSVHALTHPIIFIQDRDITHKALVQNAAAFADRPPSVEPQLHLSCGSHDISSSSYGPLWRVLRRNLTSEVLSPSRIKHFSPARQWALRVLLNKLRTQADVENGRVMASESFQFAMFCLSTAMCFGEKIDEEQIREIQAIQSFLLLLFTTFNVFAVLPQITKVVFRKKWNEILGVRRRQAEIFLSLIRARADRKLKSASDSEFRHTYVDSLIDLEIPEDGGRKLTADEIVHLCHEFMSAGTDTTSTPLEWIMAELVKHQEIQRKLLDEIETVVKPSDEEIKEEDLQKMPYLKAVIMEGLRRHPPGHILLPHAAAEDVELSGYLIPKGSELIFNTMQVGMDETVWDDPAEFRPERFLQRDGCPEEAVDLKGSREIKMMPFGVGRRMCPGYGLAMLHLEYFVANLVREFEWKGVEGDEVDLSEMFVFTNVMKNPLRARILPRMKK